MREDNLVHAASEDVLSRNGQLSAETNRLVALICHDDQMTVWAEEASWGLAECLIDPTDYEHGLMMTDQIKDVIKELAASVVHLCLFHRNASAQRQGDRPVYPPDGK